MFDLCQKDQRYRVLWDKQANPFCANWEKVTDGVYRCPRCGRQVGGHAISALPTDLPCEPAIPVVMVQQQADPGCCGQGTPSIPMNAPAQVAAPSPPPELPPLSERLRNLMVSAKDFIRDPKLCTSEEVLARLKVCDEPCPKLNGHFCSVCGCWLATATKLKSKHCPMGKWPGDEHGWKPLVHENWLGQTLAAVIHYGDVALTQACVRDCLREPVRVLVIDNQGTYTAIGKETVFTTDRNVGWGAACNLAIERALADATVQGLVLLNNDVRLSRGFFSGLIVASQVQGSKIVAPVYSHGWAPQTSTSGYHGPAESYEPKPSHRFTGYCDGTAVLLAREVLEQCGKFDLDFSPTFGWGLIMDYCVRAKERGNTVSITEASYVYHHGMQAADRVFGVGQYVVGAKAEMEEGRKRTYGDNWGWKLESHRLRPEITTRNLIYHLAPFAGNDVWLRNVRQLLRRIDLFNGKRVVAVSYGPGIVDHRTVCEAFGDHKVDFLQVANHSRLRERASAELLLDSVFSTDPHTATFYAHSKGVSTSGDSRGVTYWRNSMYHELLDDWPRVGVALTAKSCVGTHQKRRAIFPDGLKTDSWHFAGTFFWFRNDALFGQPDWRARIPNSGWGMEAYPGIMFAYDDSACVFMDEPGNSYDPQVYRNPIEDDDAMPPTATGALKIELGGGETPIGHGYLNVDKLACADVQCDFDAPYAKLPFDDDAVSDLYTSHTLEHVQYLRTLMREIVRVCRIGARVEIRVPHWNHNMAMCFTHRHAITYEQVEHWCETAIPFWFGGCAKRLGHFMTTRVPSKHFARMKALHPGWSDDEVMEHVPDTCHEYQFVFNVVPF
jgi:hypothetical protein